MPGHLNGGADAEFPLAPYPRPGGLPSATLLAACAPTDGVLVAARVLGGLSAGMAYPTTLAVITALWSGPARTRSIAMWSGLGGAISVLGPLIAGALLLHFWWGSVFLITLPLAVVALLMALAFVPAHLNETTDPVDNLGGVLSMLLVAVLVLAINFAPVPGESALASWLAIITVASAAAFVIRQRTARNPLYDLHVAGRRIFWVAGSAGIIVFGGLMGAMFVGQQFLQNVLGYSTLDAGLAIMPMAVFMVFVAPQSARLVNARGARLTLLVGYAFCLLGFAAMLLLWKQDIPFWRVGLAYALIGIGVGFAGTPASHSLTASVPVRRAGMASGTADLQRDLGGAIMQSIFGALLAAGYAAAVAASIATAPHKQQITGNVQNELTKSFASAAEVAKQYPQYATQITAGAKASVLAGGQWAYTAGIVAVLLGMALVFFGFPKKRQEEELLTRYHAEDTGNRPHPHGPAPPPRWWPARCVSVPASSRRRCWRSHPTTWIGSRAAGLSAATRTRARPSRRSRSPRIPAWSFLTGWRGTWTRAAAPPCACRSRRPARCPGSSGRAGRRPTGPGGTRIGAALKEFNDLYGCRGLARGAVVLIISDGWETGDPALLGEQMARLSRVAHRIVWANPRTQSPRYRPEVGGMAAAWPYCDAVVSAHRLTALAELMAALADPGGPGGSRRAAGGQGLPETNLLISGLMAVICAI